ncbi:WD40/YVTN/BNR-like repeat-containing protein [Segetibacter koreensis]|uniref:WD40/YVTN/BNR-like repeat-containing protein n=1 Tax=Segetibacter koreensis TaxID=398037 RepID=UPI00039BBDC0|nr:oxidoreductase [Segetibacter koreensis]
MRLLMLIISIFVYLPNTASQETVRVEVITSGKNTSLRGMSIPSDSVVWVSGSNGTIGKSVDAGKTWKWIIVAGFEKRDFRDIEAFDSHTAIAMAVDNPALIIKTTDGGNTWKKVFEREIPGMFLDAMDFKNKHEGICIGDPISMEQTEKKKFFIIRTFDGGDSWKEIPSDEVPTAYQGEAIFAASGTNISFLDNPGFEYGFVTGGAVSNLYLVSKRGIQNKIVNIPMAQGKETEGVFSMATNRKKIIYCIGGDYKIPSKSVGNYRYTKDEGRTWNSAIGSAPFGYRSCIRIISKNMLVSCGPSGVDFAINGQKEWKNVSNEGFNVCMVSKGKQVFLAGEKGKIGRLIYHY